MEVEWLRWWRSGEGELAPAMAMAASCAAAAGARKGEGGGREWNEGVGRERANARMLKALSGSVWPNRVEQRRCMAVLPPRGGQRLMAVSH